MDKTYPMLEDDARQQSVLQRYLSQLCVTTKLPLE